MSADLLAIWHEADPARKCAQLAALGNGSDRPDLAALAAQPLLGPQQLSPGRPHKPVLVSPREVPRRGLGTDAGRAALIHAIAHIEFNAINLALDAALRFSGMPEPYYADWLSVAQDEARHFSMLSTRLGQMGYQYGDFPAHNGLWEAAEKTADDVLTRMALVPRVLEARGLDVTPQMILRLQQVRDVETADLLKIILQEEVRHVAIGTQWFAHLCRARGLDSVSTFQQLIREHGVRLQGPFNIEARSAAGFDPAEWNACGDGDAALETE